MAFWKTLRWPDRLLLVGAAGMVVGAGAVVVAGGRNRNDVPGASAVLVVLGVVAAAGWLAARREGGWTELAPASLLGAALAGLVLTGLELLESARLGFAADRLGLLGLAGRVFAFAAAIVLLVAAWRVARGGLLLRGLPRLLAIAGTTIAIGGWAVLIGAGEGFAMRTVDAAGIAAAVGIAVFSLRASGGRGGQLLGIGLAVVVTLALADAVVILAPSIGDLLDAGPATWVSVAAYLGGAAAVAASQVVRLRMDRRVGLAKGPVSAQ